MMKIYIAPDLLSELQAFVSHVRELEGEPVLRPVATRVSSDDGLYHAIQFGLDRGDGTYPEFKEIDSGLRVAIIQEVLDGLNGKCCPDGIVVSLKHRPSLTVEFTELHEFIHANSESSEGLVRLHRVRPR